MIAYHRVAVQRLPTAVKEVTSSFVKIMLIHMLLRQHVAVALVLALTLVALLHYWKRFKKTF